MNKPGKVLPVDLYADEWRSVESDAPASFQFIAASDMPVNPIVWLVRDYLEQSTLAVLFGPPGKGKSFFALDLSCCVATGKTFHGFEVRQGAVFYIAGEGHSGLSRRLRAWSQHNKTSLSGVPLFVSEGPADLAHATVAARVGAAVQELSSISGQTPMLIVIDTLARNFGGDENSAAEIGHFVHQVDLNLRRTSQTTILIIHHSGKDGDRGARGSSALKGAADAEYELSRNGGDQQIRLASRKMKDAEEPPPLAFELVTVSIRDDAGGALTSAVLRRVAFVEVVDPPAVGLGKNQQTLLLILRQMHEEIAERLVRQGRPEKEVLILEDDWRQRCLDADIARNRFKEARDALVKRGAVQLERPHVFLADNTVRNGRTL